MKNYPVKRNPFGLDFFSDDFFKPFFALNRDCSAMKTDVVESEDAYKLEIDLPGVLKENISIELEDKYLTVAVKSEEVKEEKNQSGHFIRRERQTGSCSRSYYVGDIKEEDVDASYIDGVLKVSFPKKSAKQIEQKKQIDIK